MDIIEIESGDSIEDVRRLWTEMVEELDQYLTIQSIDDGYRSVIRSTLNERKKGDDNVLFVCFDDSTDGSDLFTSDVGVYIEALYVSEPHRGQGYGSQLVERVENWASDEVGADQITLAVESNNIPAQEFWKDKGYRTTLEKRVKSVDQTTSPDLAGAYFRNLIP